MATFVFYYNENGFEIRHGKNVDEIIKRDGLDDTKFTVQDWESYCTYVNYSFKILNKEYKINTKLDFKNKAVRIVPFQIMNSNVKVWAVIIDGAIQNGMFLDEGNLFNTLESVYKYIDGISF